MASKKSDIDPNFDARLQDVISQAAAEATARQEGGQVPWFRPRSNEAFWTGSLFDYEGFKPPFSRETANEEYQAAVKDPEDAGVAGDLVATTTQIDVLSAMERAYLARMTSTYPRMLAHMSGRKAGHGQPNGPIGLRVLDYVRNLLKQAGGFGP